MYIMNVMDMAIIYMYMVYVCVTPHIHICVIMYMRKDIGTESQSPPVPGRQDEINTNKRLYTYLKCVHRTLVHNHKVCSDRL